MKGRGLEVKKRCKGCYFERFCFRFKIIFFFWISFALFCFWSCGAYVLYGLASRFLMLYCLFRLKKVWCVLLILLHQRVGGLKKMRDARCEQVRSSISLSHGWLELTMIFELVFFGRSNAPQHRMVACLIHGGELLQAFHLIYCRDQKKNRHRYSHRSGLSSMGPKRSCCKAWS